MLCREATADDSLAAILARKKFGIAIPAMINRTATTSSSSINEKPFCLPIAFSPAIVTQVACNPTCPKMTFGVPSEADEPHLGRSIASVLPEVKCSICRKSLQIVTWNSCSDLYRSDNFPFDGRLGGFFRCRRPERAGLRSVPPAPVSYLFAIPF
jgi:hypothetical protein